MIRNSRDQYGLGQNPSCMPLQYALITWGKRSMNTVCIPALKQYLGLSQCGKTADHLTLGPKVLNSNLTWASWLFPYAGKFICIARWPSLVGMLIGLRPHHCSFVSYSWIDWDALSSRDWEGAPQSIQLLKRVQYLVFAVEKKTAVWRIVGSIVWAFLRLKS